MVKDTPPRGICQPLASNQSLSNQLLFVLFSRQDACEWNLDLCSKIHWLHSVVR